MTVNGRGMRLFLTAARRFLRTPKDWGTGAESAITTRQTSQRSGLHEIETALLEKVGGREKRKGEKERRQLITIFEQAEETSTGESKGLFEKTKRKKGDTECSMDSRRVFLID